MAKAAAEAIGKGESEEEVLDAMWFVARRGDKPTDSELRRVVSFVRALSQGKTIKEIIMGALALPEADAGNALGISVEKARKLMRRPGVPNDAWEKERISLTTTVNRFCSRLYLDWMQHPSRMAQTANDLFRRHGFDMPADQTPAFYALKRGQRLEGLRKQKRHRNPV